MSICFLWGEKRKNYHYIIEKVSPQLPAKGCNIYQDKKILVLKMEI